MKIKQVQPNGNVEIQGKNFYKFEVQLEDGTSGEVLALKPDRWKAGDEVEVERSETPYGMKFKLRIPQQGRGNFQKTSGSYQKKESPEVKHRIDASWAIGQAVAMGAKEHKELVSKALALLDARNAVLEAISGAPEAKPEPKPEDTHGATLGDNPIF